MDTFRDLRLRNGLTQIELARRSGVRQATISAIENGHSRPQRGTVVALARVLAMSVDDVHGLIWKSVMPDPDASDSIAQMSRDWPFLAGLDRDLRLGLAQELVARWTHSSTAIEGNTISAGDTLFVITQGLTVSGKSLREHQEIHGHAQAIALMVGWTRARHPVQATQLHDLHRAIQTGAVIDALAPIGRWKVEQNGTTAITTSGTTAWHEYAKPVHVPALVDQWLRALADGCREAVRTAGHQGAASQPESLRAYTDAHLGFVVIHPYADGNGRMARLLANIPLLRAGLPPLLVAVERRRDYMTLLGDYSLRRGQPKPGEPLVLDGPEREALAAFFASEWTGTVDLVASYHRRQAGR